MSARNPSSCIPHPISTVRQYMDSTPHVGLYGHEIPELDKYRILYPKVVSGGFLNLSGLFIPLEVEILLSFGPNYSPLTPPDISSYMVAIKNYSDGYLEKGVDLKMYNREDLELHYSCFVAAMLNHQQQTLYHRMLSHLFQVTLSFLRKHSDLIIVQADKGKTSILIPRVDYIDKVQVWLDSYVSSGACIVYKDDRAMLLRHLTALYRRLALPLCRLFVLNPTLFPRPIYLELHEKRNSPPEISYLYGSLKIHKDGCPIRSICSPVDWLISPIHKLCGLFLKQVLDERLSKNNLDNMDHLTGHLISLEPISGYVFITLDIKEMYPKTQLEPLWAVLQDLMARDWFRNSCPIEISLLERMLKFILYQANYFSFNSIWYQQIEGLPQGGSASGYLAKIFLDSRLDDR
ncbi:uncharacterized protein LOC119672846 [Teleopsis dalmanni]|uniref:uncharacterized protein LOC119672846 n=1 Tax=Teleopsis dalmanni TaxID=139649 RepID=UPI0018CE223F|nr:uncharacterized protein LOC119672846 [Teleopsis dalmanni]